MNFKEEARQILDEYHRAERNADSGVVVNLWPYVKRLVKAHNKAAYETALGAVGEDEPKPDYGIDMAAANDRLYIGGKNEARAEIRTNLKQAFNQGEAK